MKRRALLAVLALGLIAATLAGPTARVAIQTHDLTDPSPHRVEATIALGKAALTLLVTWTSHVR